MAKQPRTAHGGDAVGRDGGSLVERLPEALLMEVLGRLELDDACSAAASCRALGAAASVTISAITTLDFSIFAPSNAILNRVLAGNDSILSLTINCSRLDDYAAAAIAKHSLRELSLLNCSFSHRFFTEIGENCPDLRSLKVEIAVNSVAFDLVSDGFSYASVVPVFGGCRYLETLWLKFPVLGPRIAAANGVSFIIPGTIKEVLLQPADTWWPKVVFNTSNTLATTLESISLVLDTVTNEIVVWITQNISNLVKLCLEDESVSQPWHGDLTNVGLQALGSCHNLRHLSLIRHCSDFRRVNDFGILMLAEGCKQLRSIRLGAFSKVSDAGYAALLHSCEDLCKFEVRNGSCLSDLACRDLDKAAPNVTEVRLLSCALLTSDTAISLASCLNLKVLDLSGCISIADSGLVPISQLSELTLLDLAGADITDVGLSALGNGKCPISSLCLRGCKRITSNGIASLLGGSGTINKTLVSLDVGNVLISGKAVAVIAEKCRQISSLSLRNCLFITDSSLEMLGSMVRSSDRCSLRMLDVAYCSKLSRNFLKLFEPPLFRGLRWLGVGKNVVDRHGCSPSIAELLEQKPGLAICVNACEMGCRNKFLSDIRVHQ